MSWSSLQKRKASSRAGEQEDPRNSKEIGVARSYGDLRENFEFKAAKECKRPDAAQIGLETRFIAPAAPPSRPDTARSPSAQSSPCAKHHRPEENYTILGPGMATLRQHHILSDAIGQALLGHRLGEIVD